jgi:hypothetical protein
VASTAPPLTTEPPIRVVQQPRDLPPLNELPPVTPPPSATVPMASPPPAPGAPVVAAQPAPPPALPAIPPVPAPAAPAPLPPPLPVPGTTKLPATPAPLPSIPVAPDLGAPAPLPVPGPVVFGPVVPGPIDVNGVPLPFDSLAHLIDGGTDGFGGCPSCGGSCAGGQCRAGQKKCEPFPARTCAGRFVGLVYQTICCPDPCYQPRWEPITAAAFFADAPRPVTQTRVRWDYGSRLTFPDRGEYFWPRADGNGKGPKPNPPALGVPFLDYHEFYVDQEIAAGGMGSVTISQPYRSVNPTPYAESAAGFGNLQITAKSLLFDSELFLFAFQMRTYIPTGKFGNGIGNGHLSLEPGVIAGVRVSPDTYALAQVQEWIPIAGDKDYMGAALRYNFSLNHVLWRPVRDVQLIGTWETGGIAFQDGAFTDPVAGSLQKLSGQTTLSMGLGGRLFFCDKFDLGAGWQHGITGKYLVQDQLRVEVRYRY